MATRERKKLDIKCTDSDCSNNLHCFRATKVMIRENTAGTCRQCGADLIDWSRIHKRALGDTSYTFDALKNELIRHHFWHKEIDEKAVRHAHKKGKKGVQAAAKKRLVSSIAKEQPYRDGYQTPYDGNVLYYAQHATACCCRKCLEYWHDIPMGRELSDDELDYLAELVMLYVNERLPDLTEEGERL